MMLHVWHRKLNIKLQVFRWVEAQNVCRENSVRQLLSTFFICHNTKGANPMSNILLNKKQAKEVAQAIYPDIKNHALDNFSRYFPWWLSEEHKEKGKTREKEKDNTTQE